MTTSNQNLIIFLCVPLSSKVCQRPTVDVSEPPDYQDIERIIALSLKGQSSEMPAFIDLISDDEDDDLDAPSHATETRSLESQLIVFSRGKVTSE